MGAPQRSQAGALGSAGGDAGAPGPVGGRGVGRALIEALYARARAAGAQRVYWHTHETNARARALYDRVAEHGGFLLYRKDL